MQHKLVGLKSGNLPNLTVCAAKQPFLGTMHKKNSNIIHPIWIENSTFKAESHHFTSVALKQFIFPAALYWNIAEFRYYMEHFASLIIYCVETFDQKRKECSEL